MTSTNTQHYDRVSIALHWLTAIVVTIAFVLGPEHFGRLMRDGVDPATRSDIVWHETLGVLIFVLTLARLLWVARRPAAPQFPISKWMLVSSKLVKLSLWTLLLALPLTALLALGGEDHPLTLLGGLRIDHWPLIAHSAVGKLVDWGDVHKFLGDAIMWIAGLHAAAAAYHAVALDDGVFGSMLPGKESS
jgi:cytochrome b561